MKMNQNQVFATLLSCCLAAFVFTGCKIEEPDQPAQETTATAETATEEPTPIVVETNDAAETSSGIDETKDTYDIDPSAVPMSETTTLPAPSFEYYCSEKAAQTPVANKLNLTQKKKEANSITDDDAWFTQNGLSIEGYDLPNPFVENDQGGNLPADIPADWYGMMITKAFSNGDYLFCTYGYDFSEGDILNILDPQSHELLYSLDFAAFQYYGDDVIDEDIDYIKESVNWAKIDGQTLYVTTFHNTYASSSANKNGYITAIDLTDMSILWRSDALVNNASTFEIINDVIVCGYGFTDEDDYLYQLDTHTGKTLDRIPLKSGPSYIFNRDGVLYVRTYNTNYEFTY